MGRDKALLPVHGTTLIEHVARAMESAVGNVTVIGYEIAEFPSVPDEIPGCGPLGGLYTALGLARKWAVVAAVDMPNITAGLLLDVAEIARRSPADAVVCEASGRLHPLCAAYRSTLRGAAHDAILKNSLRMHDFLASIFAVRVRADPRLLENVNTPEELRRWGSA